MTPIRPLLPDDLDAVTALYEAVARSGSRNPAPGVREQFERTVLANPQADEEMPSLVYDDPAAGIVGFLGSHPRRLTFGERTLRMACSGQLVADPDASPGVGALLLRKYMSGPQDLTITDGATETVHGMWTSLGGKASSLASMGWTRVLAPAAYARALAERRGRTVPGAPARLADAAASRLAGARLEPTSDTTTDPLTPEALIGALSELRREFPLRPAYDEAFLAWLLGEAAAVTARGELRCRLVRRGEATLGWYVAYLPGEGIAQVLQVGCGARHSGAVLDRLFTDCAEAGCAAVQGRLESHLLAAIRERPCLVRRTEWALVAAADPAVLAAIAYGDALLTRLDGEWWMGHHL